MSLNLTQTRSQIKSAAPVMQLNPGSQTWINAAYRELKTLGWACINSEVHPTERTPIFRLGNASIRRDKANPGSWLVDSVGCEFRFDGDLTAITADVQAMEAEAAAEVAPALSPEAEAAADLKAQYPHLAGRIDAGLALVEAGQISFPKYQTSNVHSNGGRDNRDCNCPDAQYRGFRTDFGIACKHTLAQEIVSRAGRITNRLVINELTEQQDRRRLLPADVGTGKSILDYLDYDLADAYRSPASYRLPADPLNVKRGSYTHTGAYRPAGM